MKSLEIQNNHNLKHLFQEIKVKHKTALETPVGDENYKDDKVYRPEEIAKYGKEFLGYVEPQFIQEMVKNR